MNLEMNPFVYFNYCYCQDTHSIERLPLGWYLFVEKTYCDKCQDMTPCRTYQGHFICLKCGELTGFWMPMLFDGVKDIPGVKKWKKGGKALESVSFVLNGKVYGI